MANKNNKSNNKLHKLQRYYETIIAKMPGHVFWKNKNGIFMGCNDQQAKTLGYSTGQEVIGKTTYDMVWSGQPEAERRRQAQIIDENDRHIMQSGIPQVLEEPLILPDGRKAIYLSNKTPLYDENEKVIGIVGFSFDITAQKETETLKLEQETLRRQLDLMRTLAATIAHELRTPLLTIALAAEVTKQYIPKLISTYTLAKAQNLAIENIRPSDLKSIVSSLDEIIEEVNESHTIINMMLFNAEQLHGIDANFKILSIHECIDEALKRYPFDSNDKKLVHVDMRNNFYFKGEKTLTVHIVFNLLKNAIYYVKAAGKGEIQIWLETSKQCNKLHFKDTGKGIASDILPNVLKLFYSKTYHGSGVGLAYCQMVMENYDGTIECQSIEGEFTEFILTFPVVEASREF